VDPKIKFRLVEKFPTKMMIWLAIQCLALKFMVTVRRIEKKV